jgi:hypothetical protein
VTPLSDALTAAQRSALAALEKAYVAGSVDDKTMVAKLVSVGISDSVDIAFLLAAPLEATESDPERTEA